MDQWIRRFRSAETVAGQEKVLIPGDIEREMEGIRMREGIPLLQPVIDDLAQLAGQLDIPILSSK
jgi:LDH2 family malate/lactate/ureidoglycolate dehydrogenase